MSSFQARVVSYFREVSIVVIGVLIAIYMGNLKEQYENNHFIDQTMIALQAEARKSQKSINTVLEKHLLIMDSLRVQLESGNDEESLMDLVGRLGGIQIAQNNNNVLRFFISTKAELLDYEMISMLSEVEFSTNLMNRKMDKLLDFAYMSLQSADLDAKLKFAAYLSNVIDSEGEMVEQYDELLDKYKDYFPEVEE